MAGREYVEAMSCREENERVMRVFDASELAMQCLQHFVVFGYQENFVENGCH